MSNGEGTRVQLQDYIFINEEGKLNLEPLNQLTFLDKNLSCHIDFSNNETYVVIRDKQYQKISSVKIKKQAKIVQLVHLDIDYTRVSLFKKDLTVILPNERNQFRSSIELILPQEYGQLIFRDALKITTGRPDLKIILNQTYHTANIIRTVSVKYAHIKSDNNVFICDLYEPKNTMLFEDIKQDILFDFNITREYLDSLSENSAGIIKNISPKYTSDITVINTRYFESGYEYAFIDSHPNRGYEWSGKKHNITTKEDFDKVSKLLKLDMPLTITEHLLVCRRKIETKSKTPTPFEVAYNISFVHK